MLQGHDSIQKVFHRDETNDVMVLKFANGGDLRSYGLDNFGATRKYMPEVFLWHFLRSMAAALAYCQAGWKDGEPFVAKEGWRPIIHQDVATGNILLHWHRSNLLPQLVLSDFGDAKLLDEMPPRRFDFLLQALRSRDPAMSHMKRDLQDLGSNFQSMLVLALFGGNARKMQEEYNVDLAFDFAQKQEKPAFSPELAEWVDKLAYNERTDKGTKFVNALEFAKELIPLADRKVSELSDSAAELPGRRFSDLDGHDGSTSFRAPLEKDVRAFVEHYDAEDGIADDVGLKKAHRRGELDPEFEKYRAANIDRLRRNEKPFLVRLRLEESGSEESNAEEDADEPGITKASLSSSQEKQDGSLEATCRKAMEKAPLQEPGATTQKHPACDQEMVYRSGRRSSVTGKMELNIIDPLNGTLIIKIEDTDDEGIIEAELGGDEKRVKEFDLPEGPKTEAVPGKDEKKVEEVGVAEAKKSAGSDEPRTTIETEGKEEALNPKRSRKRKHGASDQQSAELEDNSPETAGWRTRRQTRG